MPKLDPSAPKPRRRAQLVPHAAALLFLSLVLAPAAAAQVAELPVDQGTRIRVSAPGVLAQRMDGRLISATRDTLIVLTGPGTEATVPMHAIERLDRSGGRDHGGYALKFAMAGMLAGAAAGFAQAGTSEDGDGWYPSAAGPGYALIGGLTGAAVGALLAPERWFVVLMRPGRSAAVPE